MPAVQIIPLWTSWSWRLRSQRAKSCCNQCWRRFQTPRPVSTAGSFGIRYCRCCAALPTGRSRFLTASAPPTALNPWTAAAWPAGGCQPTKRFRSARWQIGRSEHWALLCGGDGRGVAVAVAVVGIAKKHCWLELWWSLLIDGVCLRVHICVCVHARALATCGPFFVDPSTHRARQSPPWMRGTLTWYAVDRSLSTNFALAEQLVCGNDDGTKHASRNRLPLFETSSALDAQLLSKGFCGRAPPHSACGTVMRCCNQTWQRCAREIPLPPALPSQSQVLLSPHRRLMAVRL